MQLIQATIIKNRPGTISGMRVYSSPYATYGGVADRDLTLSFVDGSQRAIEDREEIVSTDVLPGVRYAFVFYTWPNDNEKITYSHMPHPKEERLWEGQIVARDWDASSQSYLRQLRSLSAERWIVLQTDLGQLVFPPKRLNITIKMGDYVQWRPRRQLIPLAVVAIEQPTPTNTVPYTQERPAWQQENALDSSRIEFLTERRRITPDVERGTYPFRDIPLTRADVEWLLLTHVSAGLEGTQAGPVDWTQPLWRDRPGIDLRGADLRGTDLAGLSLAGLVGGLRGDAWYDATAEQRNWAAIHLEGANLSQTHLEGALLRDAQMQDAILTEAHCDSALLRGASLLRASCLRASFAYALASGIQLAGADLREAILDESDLVLADLHDANLHAASLENAIVEGVLADHANFTQAHLKDTFWLYASIVAADFTGADLDGADLDDAFAEPPFVSPSEAEGETDDDEHGDENQS